MLTIRPEQAAALAAKQHEQFERFMLAHIARFFPEQFATAGEAATLQTIHDGTAKATSHGFTSERDVCKYIDLMMAFGPYFDRLPWAATVLETQEPMEPAVRMNVLCERALEAEQEDETESGDEEEVRETEVER